MRDRFESQGFKVLFTSLQTELNDDYLSLMNGHLGELKFRNGILISAELGKGNIGVNYTLHKQPDKKELWLKWLVAPKFTIHKRDDSGAQDLSNAGAGGSIAVPMRPLRQLNTSPLFLPCYKSNLLFTSAV